MNNRFNFRIILHANDLKTSVISIPQKWLTHVERATAEVGTAARATAARATAVEPATGKSQGGSK